MAKRNGNNGKNLPARTTAKVPQRHGGSLNSGGTYGNRGGGDKPDSFRIRANAILERAKGLDVLGAIVSGDILELVGSKNGEPIIGFTANADRIRAFRELRECAGHGAPSPVKIEAQGDVKVIVVYDADGEGQ